MENTNFTAVFYSIEYDVIAEASPSDTGTVSETGEYNYNTEVTLFAIPKKSMTSLSGQKVHSNYPEKIHIYLR